MESKVGCGEGGKEKGWGELKIIISKLGGIF